MRKTNFSKSSLSACNARPVHTDGPVADSCTAAKRALLFDHVVGGGEQRLRHIKAERSSSLEVDHQLELGGRLNGKLAWFCAPEDAIGI